MLMCNLDFSGHCIALWYTLSRVCKIPYNFNPGIVIENYNNSGSGIGITNFFLAIYSHATIFRYL